MILLGALAGFEGSRSAHACTVMRFQVGDHYLVARNHDWMFGEGLIVVEPRGLAKSALTPVRPARWTSRYGSVSITQFGRGIPFAGMNEAGLTVDLLQLNQAEFAGPTSHTRDTVNAIQWVQYQLDMSADVDQVIESLDQVLPLPLIPAIERVHFFVTDASGGVAIVEFIDGNPVIRRGPNAMHCALANTDIETSIREHGAADQSRYGRAVRNIARVERAGDVDQATEEAFDALESVSQPGMTQWSLVYRPEQKRLTFHTRSQPSLRWIDLDDFDLAAGAETLALDVMSPQSGNLRPHFKPITPANNQRIIHHSMDQYFPPGIGRVAVKQLLLNYPSTIEPTKSASAATEE